jgi:hypothetical protein
MSITKLPPQHLATRLIISPCPSTLGESTAVLKRLQSFGQVLSFTPSPQRQKRHARPRTESTPVDTPLHFTVVFSSLDTINAVRAASPLSVRVNHNLPDPKVEDPYNVRSLQSRQQPAPKTMLCQLDIHPAEMPRGQTTFSTGFSPSDRTRLHQSLQRLSPPPSVAAALTAFHNQPTRFSPTSDLVDPAPSLTAMYRKPRAEPKHTPPLDNHGEAPILPQGSGNESTNP